MSRTPRPGDRVVLTQAIPSVPLDPMSDDELPARAVGQTGRISRLAGMSELAIVCWDDGEKARHLPFRVLAVVEGNQ